MEKIDELCEWSVWFHQKKGMRSKRWLLGWICLMLSAMVGLDRAQAGSPTEAVRGHVDRAIAVLEESQAKEGSTEEAKLKKLRAIANDLFDFGELSRRTLGRTWREMTENQRREFVSLFKKVLEDVYADRVLAYTDEKVLYKRETMLSEDKAEVRTEILTGDKQIPIHYRMVHEDGEWKVYDVVVEGVGLVRNYRTQFKEILINKSVEELLQILRDKVQG